MLSFIFKKYIRIYILAGFIFKAIYGEEISAQPIDEKSNIKVESKSGKLEKDINPIESVGTQENPENLSPAKSADNMDAEPEESGKKVEQETRESDIKTENKSEEFIQPVENTKSEEENKEQGEIKQEPASQEISDTKKDESGNKPIEQTINKEGNFKKENNSARILAHSEFTAILQKIFAANQDSGLYAGFSGDFYQYYNSFVSSGKGLGIRLEWKQSPYFSGIMHFSSGLLDLNYADLLAKDNQQNLYNLILQSGYTIGYMAGSAGVMFSYPFLKTLSAGIGANFNLTQIQGTDFNFTLDPGLEIESAFKIQVIPNLEAGVLASYKFMNITSLEYQKHAYILMKPINSPSLQIQVYAVYRIVSLKL